MKKKIIIDILMFILMLLEFSRGYLEPIYHEIFGILLFILVIIHLILNKNYIKNIFKGKYNISRIIMLIINILFFTTFFLSIIFGILSSEELLTFLSINSLTIIKLHKVISYICLITLGMHLGINMNAIFGKIIKIIKSKIVLYIISLIIIVYGIYSFIKLDIFKHLIGTYGFSIIEGNIFINILRYFSIVMSISIIINIITKILKRRNNNER